MSATTTFGALLVLVGLGAVAIALQAARARRVRDLSVLLDLRALAPADAEDAEETSSLLAKSGAYAERALGHGSSLITRIATVLERSDWTLSAGEFLVVTAVAGALPAVLAGLVGGVLAAMLFGVTGLLAPYVLVCSSVTRRRTKFEAQFPDVLEVIAASLESGASVAQALELVVEEADEPVAGELGRVLSATRLGATLPEALDVASERLGSRDLEWTVQAISVQQRTGGRLAEILRIVARTMRARSEVKRELRALTAEGKLSAYVLGGLPFLLAGAISLLNPGYLSPLFHDPLGILMLAGSIALMGIAIAFMVRIVRVEV